MLSSDFKKIEVAFHCQTSAVAQHRLRPNKLNWTHNYKNKFTFLRFLYSLPNPQSSSVFFVMFAFVCVALHNAAHRSPFPVTMWYSYIQFGSISMWPLKEAVINELWGKVCILIQLCVLLCVYSTHLCLDHFLWLYSQGADMALMLARMDMGQAEQHSTLYIWSAGCTLLCSWLPVWH
jgi:hypothetical protein